jgi:hypothetical protein
MRVASVALAALCCAALPSGSDAQGRGRDKPPPGHKKEFVVGPDKAITVTREVLVRQGYEVVRVEVHGHDRVVYYRRGNMGRGKGKGPLVKMVVRRVENRIIFVDTPDDILLDINVRLRL